MPPIAQAAVTTWEPEPGRVETRRLLRAEGRRSGDLAVPNSLRRLKRRLPDYMVPSYLEEAAGHPDDGRQQGRPAAAAEAD